MLNNNEQKQEVYNYFISSFDILYTSGGVSKIAPSMVYSFSKLDDFDNNFFPIFNIKFHVHVNDYYNILKDKTGVKFRIRLQKGKMDNNKTDSSNIIKTDVFNDIFSCYISESTPFVDEKTYNESKNIRGTTKTSSPEDYSKTMDLYLFKEKDIDGTKKIINKVLGNLTLTDMVFDLYSSCGLTSNFLMQKFENNTTFSEIVVPPLPLLGALRYLQNTYSNFYDGSATIFFDFSTKYLLKKQIGCSAWKSQEFKQTVFVVRDANSSQKDQVSCEKNTKEKKFYISISPDMISVDKSSILNDATDASIITIVDSKTGSTQNINIDLDKRGTGSTKVVYQTQENSRLGKEVESELKSKGMSISITCNNIDIDAVTPNKEFVVKFLDKQSSSNLSGSYRLSSISNTFIQNGSSGYNMVSTIKLTK